MTGPQIPSQATTVDTENVNPQVNTPPVETPPAPPAPAPAGPTIEQVTNVYNEALREASQRARNLEIELERERAAHTPQVSPEQDKEAFFENPRKMIREEMKQMIEPLNETSRMFQRNQLIGNFIERARVLPAYKYLANPNVYNGFLQAVSSLPEINDQILTATYNMVVGHAFSTGMITFDSPAPTPTPVPQPTSNQPNVPTPPPSAPPTPPLRPVDNTRKRRELTEHEKLLAKYNNMSEDDYYDFLMMDKSQVATSKVGVK